jgi:hypothetical protein
MRLENYLLIPIIYILSCSPPQSFSFPWIIEKRNMQILSSNFERRRAVTKTLYYEKEGKCPEGIIFSF